MNYRKKPVVIAAIQYDGTNSGAIADAFGTSDSTGKVILSFKGDDFIISTLEGDMKVSQGDYVIRGVNGELYPCKPDIFEKTYDAAPAQSQAQTFGQKAVGLSFNPSGNDAVTQCKQGFADRIDQLNELLGESLSPTQREFTMDAIKQIITGQMWAVKVLTWKD